MTPTATYSLIPCVSMSRIVCYSLNQFYKPLEFLFLTNKEGIEDIRGNKKSFHHHNSDQRLNKENVGLLLNVAGDLGTADTSRDIMTWVGGQPDQ